MNKKTTAVMLIVAGLLIANLLIFGGFITKPSTLVYKDAEIIGQNDVELEILQALSKPKIVIIAEGDKEASQKTLATTNALVGLVKALPGKQTEILGIEYQNGEVVNCVDNDLEYCLNRVPGEDELLILLKYPNYQHNRILINGNTLEFQAKSGVEVLALTQLFEKAFIK